MPFIQVHTNKTTAHAVTVLRELITLSATALGKPTSVFAGTITDQPMVFRGTDGPCAVVEFKTLAGVSPDQNRELVGQLSSATAAQLGLELARVWVVIIDVEKDHWGSGGGLVSDR